MNPWGWVRTEKTKYLDGAMGTGEGEGEGGLMKGVGKGVGVKP